MSYKARINGFEIVCDTAEEALTLAKMYVDARAATTSRRIEPRSAFEKKLRALCDDIPSSLNSGPGRRPLATADVVYAAALRVRFGAPARAASVQGPHYNTVLYHMSKRTLTGTLGVLAEVAARRVDSRPVPDIAFGDLMSKGQVARDNEMLLRRICVLVEAMP